MRIVRSGRGSVTYTAVLQGEPGEIHESPCALCAGELRATDRVYVTERSGAVHALSHAPDCVRAIIRSQREEGEARVEAMARVLP